MNFRGTILVSLFKCYSPWEPKLYQHFQSRGLVKVRLKWVKNRGLDHIIDKETDLKAACLLKDAIKRSSTGFVTAKSIADWQKHLGLTIPVLRFMRRYPTLFEEFPHARYASLPCFRLTDTARLLDSQEQNIHQANEANTVERLSRVLMMLKSKAIPFHSLLPLKWDLGLPDDFDRTLVPKYPDHFQVIKGANGLSCLSLSQWREELAVSEFQKSNESVELKDGYRKFKKGLSMAFPMRFPRGYGAQKKVKAWMDDFQKLPYISPYEDSSQIDPNSDLMEKRVVGVLHELLSLTIHKKTKRNFLRSLREELNLPHKFTRIFTRYPGIFYLSLKCKTTTITLKEGYQRGKLVNEHPLARIREKYHYVMRTGVLYRSKGVNLITDKDCTIMEEENGMMEEEDSEVSELEVISDDEEEDDTDAEDKFEVSRGFPLKFFPVDTKTKVVEESMDMNVVFTAATVCVQSTAWKLGGDVTTGKRFVTTGGMTGNPGVATVSNWFRIDKYREDYKLVFCPGVCSVCRIACGDLGVIYEGGNRWLGVSDEPLAVMFKKV